MLSVLHTGHVKGHRTLNSAILSEHVESVLRVVHHMLKQYQMEMRVRICTEWKGPIAAEPDNPNRESLR